MHASFRGHSTLIVHSGRHEGGVPINEGKHEQTAWLLTVRQSLFGPHGLGLHGCVTVTKIKDT